MRDPPDRSAELALEQRALMALRSLERDPKGLEIPRIPRRSEAGWAPLSFAQQRLWFLQRLEPGSPAYNMPGATRFIGPLDVAALRHALQIIMERHEALRTTIADGVDGPVQTVQPCPDFPLPVTDLSSLPGNEREAEARRLAMGAAKVAFDLAKDPLLRAQVLRLADREHVFLLTLHHIASDAWSLGVLYRELAALYEAFVTGKPCPLPELPIQYADFGVWQRRRMESDALQRQLAYWKRQLECAPPILELPGDRPRPATSSYRGAEASLLLPGSLRGGLGALSRKEGGTIFMTLLAGFQLLLARWSGQSDVVVGAPIAGRTHVELEGLIGCFLNTLVMRTSLSGNPSFRELLARVRETALEAYTNQELPFERLVEELQPERSLNYNPLFQVLFQVENTGRGDLELHGLEAREFGRFGFSAKFDLTLRVQETAAGLCCICKYSEDLFSRETATHLLEQYQALLEQVVASPESPVRSYSLLTPRSRPLVPDPHTTLPTSRYPVVTEAVSRVVREGPGRPAIEQGGRIWTYGELGAAVDALAAALRARGVARGSVVAVTGASSFGLVTGMLAVLAAGGVMLPIASDLPELRQRLMLQEARASHLLQVGDGPANGDWIRDLGAMVVVPVDERTGKVAGAGAESWHPDPGGLPAPAEDDPAYIFFTSGTTGTPRGVLGVHRGIGHFLDWQRTTFGIAPGDRCGQLTTISFDVVLRDLLLPLWSGATLCLPPKELPPDRVLAWLASEAVSVVHVVPSLAHAWLEHAPPGLSLPSLRWLFFAGEPLTDMLIRAWREVVPECGVVNLYGPTETTMAKCCYRVPQELLPGVQPVGGPLPQCQALVLSEENRLCGVNEPGEIVLRTPFMTRGYINDSREQGERFIANPFGSDPGDLAYRTGDLGRYRPDGTLMVLGRLDHQIKIRGVRIEPEEVTAVLSRHPQVRACAVIGRELDAQPMALVAYVVAGQGETGGAALRRYLAERLPAPLVPSAFVFLERLPLTPNGKLDHHGLPVPEAADRQEVDDHGAPRTPLEEAVARMWGEVLGLARVGVHDDFFGLGGHSLLATRIVARVRTAFGVELPLRTLFEAPTVAGLAVVIAQRLLATMQDTGATAAGTGESADARFE
jgi:amino acid adenylation domain-containing protein